ncbi:hypothetical protein PRIPAC_80860 [Pristionchus pacificus]|uniref:Uncharacterized protein n=1 Tax=Pristionchus pacificus TaxID=54126 RepID=A0A2A6C3Z3_PRIPA|nr:hypothetical protein PRIPAC_80860 [Pristionchus pacificus]|eukprot:PDM72836.1 hypothetical protein PRIPAC_39270 [Pristionchus pacificus]
MNFSAKFPPGSIEYALHTIPILQIVHSTFIVLALPPVILLMWFLRRIALHVNCQLLLYTWLFSFFLSIISHGSFVMCDIVTGRFIPINSRDPELRSYSLAAHGFAHAFSSIQELIFSVERAFACANPSTYHDRSLSVLPLFLAELGGIGLAFYFSYLLKIGDHLILGCIITNIIDAISLLCLIATTIWTNQKKKKLLLCGLKEKYQIQEAFETTRVMLPCGVISIVMKLCAMASAWTYGLKIIQSTFAFTVTSGLYLIVSLIVKEKKLNVKIETTNIFICSVIFLTTHVKLRRMVSQIFCPGKKQITPLSQTTQRNADLHFDSYFAQLASFANYPCKSVFVLFAFPLVTIVIYLLRKVALHVNCNIIGHASFIMCDLLSGKYIPESDNDPEYRLIIFGVHGFVHAFSSVQELLFSIERTFACANPSVYHDRSLSITPLFFSEVAALIMACLITNTVDCLSLLCLVITKIWTDRKMKSLLLSGLNEKYQIREAFEITKVMLPCGLISLIMKLCAMSLGWIYGLHIIHSPYAFTITSGLYFIVNRNRKLYNLFSYFSDNSSEITPERLCNVLVLFILWLFLIDGSQSSALTSKRTHHSMQK